MAQLLVFGYSEMFTQQAAYVSARAAAQHPENLEYTAENTAKQFGEHFLYDWDTRSNITVDYPDTKAGSTVTVTTTYNFPKFAFWESFLGKNGDDTVKGRSTQIIEEIP
jgi:hypothetical protein